MSWSRRFWFIYAAYWFGAVIYTRLLQNDFDVHTIWTFLCFALGPFAARSAYNGEMGRGQPGLAKLRFALVLSLFWMTPYIAYVLIPRLFD